MGDGTKENPFSREDVLRLIKEHGGSEELDLSGKYFEDGIDLSRVNLPQIILKHALFGDVNFEGANLWAAHLEGALLYHANLKEAYLPHANLNGTYLARAKLQGAQLWLSHLEGTNLMDAHLEGASLTGAKLDNTNLEDVDWGNYILWEENNSEFDWAAGTYRRLKMWYTEHGMYDIAGEFFFREMTAKRKALKWLPNPFPRACSKFLSILYGYGEKWHRVIISAAVVVLGLAVIYFFLGAFSPGTFPGCLYYSVASFTALGYGSWVYPEPASWAKGLGAAEAFVGVFMMALFLITFARKMTR